jgi:FemAB-related protein (PEP-CTERM system-associated)
MPSLQVFDLSHEPEMWGHALQQYQDAGVGHLYQWREIIHRAYGMEGAYLGAFEGSRIRGLLPLIFVKSRFFPQALVSMPYLNDGGILAHDREAELILWAGARTLMQKRNVPSLELRHSRNMAFDIPPSMDKVSMLLDLAGGRDHVWMKKIHGNVRNKIRKSQKMGVEVREGPEWLESFYRMHLIRMQELGSPPHSLDFFKCAVTKLKDSMRIYVALLKGEVIGGKIVCYFKDTLYFLWISSPKKYFKFAAVNLLDWQAIEDGIRRGFRTCDFGRSSVGSSHHDFKTKWGASPVQLYWDRFSLGGNGCSTGTSESSRYRLFSKIWKRLPLQLVRWLGPKLRPGLSQ